MHYWTHWASNLSQNVFGSEQRGGEKKQRKILHWTCILGITYWSMGKLFSEKLLLSKVYTAHTCPCKLVSCETSGPHSLFLYCCVTMLDNRHHTMVSDRRVTQNKASLIYVCNIWPSPISKITPSPQNQHSVHGTTMHSCIMEGEEVQIVKIPGMRSKFEHFQMCCVHRERGEDEKKKKKNNTEQPQPTGFSSVI